MSQVEGYRQQLDESDRQRARFINNRFDAIGEEPGRAAAAKALGLLDVHLRLAEATGDADDIMTTTAPHGLGERFGYDTARRAVNWWHYRLAFLNDQAAVAEQSPEATDDHFDNTQDQLEAHADAGRLLVAGDDLFVRLYAQTEYDRLRLAMRGHTPLYPLQLEQNRALALLLNAFDTLLLDGAPYAEVAIPIRRLNNRFVYRIGRLLESKTESWVYTLGVDPADSPGFRAEAMYMIKDTPGGIQQWGALTDPRTPQVGSIDSFTALNMVRHLLPQTAGLNVTRPGFRPENCTQTVAGQSAP